VGLGNPALVGLLVGFHGFLMHLHELLAKGACLAEAHFLEGSYGLVHALSTNFLGGFNAVFLTKPDELCGGLPCFLGSRTTFSCALFFAEVET
jgi:hypothetical protein